jgi:hypothetical protein
VNHTLFRSENTVIHTHTHTHKHTNTHKHKHLNTHTHTHILGVARPLYIVTGLYKFDVIHIYKPYIKHV